MRAAGLSVFDFRDYKIFLRELVGPVTRRSGTKGAIARALGCQATYLSQVLHGSANLSLEQGERLADFLAFGSDEKHFLLMLLQKDRAGTVSLKKYFDDQIVEMLNRRLTLTRRLGKQNKLSNEDQARYYGSWQYAAVHIALTIPELQNPEALSGYLGIRPKRLAEVLRFLMKTGLANRKGDRWLPGEAQIRLGNDSPNILKHHSNWRQQAVESLEREEISDLHYSGVVSLSEADALRIKDRTLEFIKKSIETIRASKEEVLYSLSIDFFSMKRN